MKATSSAPPVFLHALTAIRLLTFALVADRRVARMSLVEAGSQVAKALRAHGDQRTPGGRKSRAKA